MNLEKYTECARGFVQVAQSLALRANHQQLTPLHVLKILLDDEEGLATSLIVAAGGDAAKLRNEVGDLLFAVTNLARTLGADPEQCLRNTNTKFERRFRYVERALAEAERPLSEASLDEMEGHWQAAKAQEQR